MTIVKMKKMKRKKIANQMTRNKIKNQKIRNKMIQRLRVRNHPKLLLTLKNRNCQTELWN